MHIQRTVSTDWFLLYVTQEDTNQKAVSECESGQFLIFDIRYLTFPVKLVTYLIFETFNIKYLKFRYC